MLKHITLTGYKSLDRTTAFFAPFTAIVGRNNVGKSNLFDALHLLSNLARMSPAEAFKPENHRGDPIESFFAEDHPHITLEAEFDLTGVTVAGTNHGELTPALLTYRGELGFLNGFVVLESEHLTGQMPDGSDRHFIHRDPDRTATLRVTGNFDNGGRERYFSMPLSKSILTVIDDAELYPHIVSLAQELRSWRFFHFEPEVMRQPSPIINTYDIESNGSGLSGMLGTLQKLAPNKFQLAAHALQRGIPEAEDIRLIDTGDRRQLLALVRNDGREFTARVLSDGTLRFLALVALAYMPEPPGLIALEEPENGVHPGRLPFIVDMLRGISQRVVGAGRRPQVLTNSHSPYLVDLLEPSEMLLATLNEKQQTMFVSVGHEVFDRRPVLKEILETGEQTLGELWSQGSLDVTA